MPCAINAQINMDKRVRYILSFDPQNGNKLSVSFFNDKYHEESFLEELRSKNVLGHVILDVCMATSQEYKLQFIDAFINREV